METQKVLSLNFIREKNTFLSISTSRIGIPVVCAEKEKTLNYNDFMVINVCTPVLYISVVLALRFLLKLPLIRSEENSAVVLSRFHQGKD